MDGRFAGEVSRVEFHERGVDIVGVDRDDFRDSVAVVDLDNGKGRNGNASGGPSLLAKTKRTSARRSPRVATVDLTLMVQQFVGGTPVRHLEISTASDAGVYDRTPIVSGNVVGE